MRKASSKTYNVSAKDAAERLHVNVETVKRWAREGKVPARKNMSGFWVFSAVDLDRLPVHAVTES